MMQIELIGSLYTLWLSGASETQIYPRALGIGLPTGRFRFRGEGLITRVKGESIEERFLFNTDGESAREYFDIPTLFTPTGFDECNGWTTDEILRIMQGGNSPLKTKLVDAFTADLLYRVEDWKRDELQRQGIKHRIGIPRVMLKPISRQVITTALGWKAQDVRA